MQSNKGQALKSLRSHKGGGAATTQDAVTGLGLTLLMLSVLPLSSVRHAFLPQQQQQSEGFCFGENVHDVPHMHYAFSFLDADRLAERLHACSSTALIHHMNKRIRVTKRKEEEGEEDNQDGSEKEQASSTADASSSFASTPDTFSLALVNGQSSPVATEGPQYLLPALYIPKSKEAGGASLLQLDAPALANIMQYLALPSVASCRAVSRAFRDATLLVVPINEEGVLYVRINMSSSCGAVRPAAMHHNSNSHANGSSSTTTNATMEPIVLCRECRQPMLPTEEASANRCARCLSLNPSGTLHRVFFGQLRKDPHPAMPRQLLAMLYPSMHVPHIESHTNAADGRGKGCAWVYVTSEEDVQRLLKLNKRMFLDIDEYGNEIVLLCPPGKNEWVKEYATTNGYIPHRPPYLPRQPMVLEIPDSSNRGPPHTGRTAASHHHPSSCRSAATNSAAPEIMQSTTYRSHDPNAPAFYRRTYRPQHYAPPVQQQQQYYAHNPYACSAFPPHLAGISAAEFFESLSSCGE